MKAFDKVIGYEAVKNELIKIVDLLKNREHYKKFNIKAPTGILFSGEPGMGKTLMANCFMEAVGFKSYTIRKTKNENEFIDYIREVFKEAENNQPSIILLDDIDKYAKEDENNSKAESFVVIQSCMDEIKDKDIIVLATANEIDCLPLSLLRNGRLGMRCYFENPDLKETEEIIKYYLKDKQTDNHINYESLAKILNSSSCAKLETIVNKAGIIAGFKRKEKIGMDEMVEAAVDILYDGPRMVKERPLSAKEKIAYHEAGHVVVAETLESGSVSLCTILPYYAQQGGFTCYYNSEDYFYNINKMYDRVAVLLGGRASTEYKFGMLDTGSENDIGRAERVLKRLVCEYGSQGLDKWGASVMSRPNFSQELMADQETSVRAEMNVAYRRTQKIIADNFDFVERTAKALMEKEIITGDEIEKIKSQCKHSDS